MRRRTYLNGGASLGATVVGGVSNIERALPRTAFRRAADDGPVEVEIVDTNAPVDGGDLLEVRVEVTNTGETAVRPDIDYFVDGEHRITVRTTIEPGETKSLRRYQHRTYPVRRTDSVTVRVEAAGDADERTVTVRWIDKLRFGETAPDSEIAVRPGTTVQFEVASSLLDERDAELHWFVDGEYEGSPVGPWYSAYYAEQGAKYWQHTFESEGTHEVAAAVVTDAENYWTAWTIRTTPDGIPAPTIDATRPAGESLRLRPGTETELELDVTARESGLDRVVWWLGQADVLLDVVDVTGTEDTASLTLDGGCHTCSIIAWVITDAGTITTAPVWVIESLRNHLLVFSYANNDTGSYTAEVSGVVEASASAGAAPYDHRAVTVGDDEDVIDGGRVEGAVAGGGDAYLYSGTLESFSLERNGDSVFAYRNGEPLDDWTAANRPHHLVITGGSGADHVVTYDVEATGPVSRSVRAHDAPVDGDAITADPEDDVRGGSVTGAVAGGIDAFYYVGDLARFRIDDCDHESVRVWIDGVERDPCSIGGSSP